MTDAFDRLKSALSDRYTVERELGSGGMATVYLAHDLKHDRKVAIKVMRPELSAILGGERFLREVSIAAKLNHPHILALYDSGQAEEFLYSVMPYVEGESLRGKLNREKQLAVDEAISITKQVGAALDYAHEQGVIHRDIKPENILMYQGEALVADFGIALAISAAGGTRLTETGLSLGTPEYMSPEQATGERELDARSDVYSLGAITYEMLVGEPPHTGNTVQAIIAKVVSAEPQPVSRVRHTVPSNVDAAVMCALAKTPADRFASGAVFAEALTDVAFVMPRIARVARPQSERKRAANGLTVLAFFLAALATLLALWGWFRPERPRDAHVSRYRIILPEEDLFLQSGPAIAQSPDGMLIAYVGYGEGGPQLWLKRRDELHAAPLLGTQGLHSPVFSPDGQRVAFWVSPRTLRVVSIVGEPPVTLTVGGIVSGTPAWARDGFIYLNGAPEYGNAIVRVPESGGQPERVTTPDSLANEVSHRQPVVLPGGRGIVFTVNRTGDSNNRAIAVVNLRTGKHEVLFQGEYATYSPTGHLMYATSDGTLLGVPFDERTMRTTGTAVRLLDGVRLKPTGWDLSLSHNGTLIYTSGSFSVLAPYGKGAPVWVDRGGEASTVDPPWTFNLPYNNSLDLSPDGARLAIDILDGTADIWIKQLDRGPNMRLTFVGDQNVGGFWHPDGHSLAFISNRSGVFEVYQKPSDGTGNAEVLVDVDVPIGDVAWSRDGGWLLYRTGDTRDIWRFRPGVDSAPSPLLQSPYELMHPSLSPDGRWLAYTSNESGRTEVYVRRFPDVDQGVWQVSTEGGTEPLWAHSGSEIFYIDGRGQMVAVVVATSPVFAVRESEVLFDPSPWRATGAGYRTYYDVEPGDQRFIMVRSIGPANQAELIIVENFFEELKQKVGNGND